MLPERVITVEIPWTNIHEMIVDLGEEAVFEAAKTAMKIQVQAALRTAGHRRGVMRVIVREKRAE